MLFYEPRFSTIDLRNKNPFIKFYATLCQPVSYDYGNTVTYRPRDTPGENGY